MITIRYACRRVPACSPFRVALSAVLAILTLASPCPAVEYTRDDHATIRRNLAQKKAVLIDVRETGEWKQGHLADATLVPLSKLRLMSQDPVIRNQVTQSLPQDKVIYCHCASGVRVITAAQILQKLGYDIQPLEAGYKELREAGFPPGQQP